MGWPDSNPIGSSGLNCFAADGELLWSFPFDDKYDVISSCYALNVIGNTASVYFYTEFPLCQISSQFQRSYRKTGLRGCHEFAISNSLVMFSGQYKDPLWVGYLAVLEDGKIGRTQKVEFVLPDKRPIQDGQLIGRGAEMSFFDSKCLYQANLNDISR